MSENEIETEAVVVATRPLGDEQVPGTLLLTAPMDPADVAETRELTRIGPGVPAPAATAAAAAAAAAAQEAAEPTIDPAIAAAWHGEAAEPPRKKWHRGWLLPLAVLIGVIILLLWQHSGGPLAVTGASASAGTPTIGCDTTETVTATLRTNGDAGSIIYRWVRSDGTFSDELQQPVSGGTKQVDVVLRWAFTGHGSMAARATIEVRSPGTDSASASFVYNCP